MAVVARHLIKRLSLATEDLVEAGRIVVKLESENGSHVLLEPMSGLSVIQERSGGKLQKPIAT